MKYEITLKDGRILIASPYAPLLTVTEDHTQHGMREVFHAAFAHEIAKDDVLLETAIWSFSTQWKYATVVTVKEVEDLPDYKPHELKNGFGG
jgi:hypothetical protein